MKKVLIIALVTLLLLSLTACEQAPKIETKYLITEVVHEMSEDYVLKYVYHYDENWVQTGITTYLNGELNQELTYELDLENNQILKTIMTAPDGATAEIEYKNTLDDQGNLIIQEQYAEGTLVLRNTYTYDESGNRLSQTQENPSNSTTSIITYDANGNILRTESIVDAIGERPASHAWMDYTYDENGNEIKSENYYNNGDDVRTTVTEYDSQGRKVKSTATDSYSGADTIIETREYSYEGNTETETVYDENGTLVLTGIRIYDDAGNLLSSETISEYSTQRSTYTYEKVELPVE